MDISLFVGELMYSNDCVIIPGFGGFVTHYSPAKIHPINHSFRPPSKNILFNSKLVRDDGLLIDYISEKQALSYTETKLLVETFVKEAITRLDNGGVTRFKNVGALHQDQGGKILFSPDESVNYLEEAYGLPTFVSPPIQRKAKEPAADRKFIDRKPVTLRDRQQRKLYWAYAALVPVLIVVGWYIFFGNWKPDDVQRSAIITLPDTDMIAESKTESKENVESLSNPPLESLDFSLNDNDEPEQMVVPETETPVVLAPVKKYYIIGGAFGVEANADKFVAILRQKGYDAARAGLSRSGLHAVSYFSSADKSEAMLNLEIIRREDNPSAWLLKK